MKKVIMLAIIFTALFTPLEISISLKSHTRFLTGFIAVAFAQTSVKAEVDKTSLATDEALTYKLIITSSEKNIPAPQLPKFTGFKVISSAQSSSVTLTKGNVKTIVVYVFVLIPIDVGKLKIEPSSIKIKNETFSTEPFEIEVNPVRNTKPLNKENKISNGVKQGKAKPKPKAEPGRRPSLPEEAQPETEQPPQITL